MYLMEEELKKLIAEGKVIPFVGAGVSMAIKDKEGNSLFPSWSRLLESFIPVMEEEYRQRESKDEKKLVEDIKKRFKNKPMSYLAIADSIEAYLTVNDFNKHLKTHLTVDYNTIEDKSYELPQSIWGLGSKLIITTNYDNILHKASQDKNIKYWDIQSIHEQGNAFRDGISSPTVWNLHGNINNINNIILSTKKYKQLYTDNINDSEYKSALHTLQHFITSHSLLFIGFSLDDMFIVNQLNHIINIFGGNTHEHYVLLKKGVDASHLNRQIKVIRFESYGQPLIDKVKSLRQTPIINGYTPKKLGTIPSKNESFIGREKDLIRVEEQLNQESLTYIVNGIGGIGKSMLANEYFHRYKNRYKYIAFIAFDSQEDSSLETLFVANFSKDLKLDVDSSFDDIIRELQKLPHKNLILIDNLENKKELEKIKLLNSNFDILITTRLTNLDTRYQLTLDTLNDRDAKALFSDIYQITEDISDILEYLDNHPLLINLTAKSLQEGYLSLDELKKEIKNGNLYKIYSQDSKSIQKHINHRFKQQFKRDLNKNLKKLIKLLSAFPSIEINFDRLQEIFKDEKNLKIDLIRLSQMGWLSKSKNGFKLHQIIKEYLWTKHLPSSEEISPIFEYFSSSIANSADAQTAVDNRSNIIYLEALLHILGRQEQENEKIARYIGDMANIYESMGEYEKAEPLYLKAQKIQVESLGENHPSTATSYNNLAGLYRAMGEYEKAEPLYLKAQKIQVESLGENHPSTATSYNNLGTFYYHTQEYQKSYEFMTKAIETMKRVLPPNHPHILSAKENLKIIKQKLHTDDNKQDEIIEAFIKFLSQKDEEIDMNDEKRVTELFIEFIS